MEIGNLKGATVAIKTSWKATSKYGIFNIKGTLNGTAFKRLYIGYSGTTTGSANRIYYLKSSGSYASIYNTTALNFVFDNSSDIVDVSFISWVESNNATITGGYKAGKGIKIGDKTIKLVRHGSSLVKEVYNGDILIYRAFHNYVEGYNNYLLPAQGNGSTFTFPTYSGSNPPGEYFDHYLFKGQTYYPGDTYIYEDNPFLAVDKSLFSGETPYYYPDHITAIYSSSGSGGGGSSVSSYYRINVTGVSGIWTEGKGYSIYVETCQVNGSTTASTSVTIPYFTAGLNGFTYNGKTFRRVGIIEQPEWGKYPSSSTTAPGLISSGNIVENYTLAKNSVVKREFFEIYQGSDGKYYYFT